MLSQILRRFVHVLNPSKQISIRLCSTVLEPQGSVDVASHDKLIHNVDVTGKVLNIFNNANGQVTFYVRSVCPGNYFKVHKICVSNRNTTLLDMVKMNLALDQKVYIEGKLSTSRFQTDDGKHRSTSAIVALKVCILSDVAVANSNHESVDENSVELAGTITTNVTGYDFKSFTLATLKSANLSRSNPSSVCFNRIFVYDKSLFSLLNEARIKSDEYLVRGEISYRIYKNNNGKNVTSSYIVAKQIYRL